MVLLFYRRGRYFEIIGCRLIFVFMGSRCLVEFVVSLLLFIRVRVLFGWDRELC